MLDNLETILNTNTLELMAKNTLENIMKNSGDNSCQIKSIRGGRPATVTVGKPKDPPAHSVLSFEDVQAIQNEANLSDR